MKYSISTGLIFLLAVLTACKKPAPPDPLCSYEPVPQTTRLESGLGAVEVIGTTGEYFYLRDRANKQVASGALNGAVGVRPGEYTALLNNSTHAVFVEEDRLTKCGCGSVQAIGGTVEYYYVLDSAGKQLASATLGKAISLFPDSFTVKLNNTTMPVDIKAGGPAMLHAGLLEVTGTTNEYYYVLDSAGTQLASATLQKSTALFRGTWTVKVNNTTVPVEIKPGETASLQTGTLMVRGTTSEYYYVLNDAGTQLASAQLDKATALLPGTYRIKLNNSIAPATVTPSQVTDLATGTVTAKKAGSDYYYVLDDKGTQLASSQVNRPSALLSGQYTVRVGESKKLATVNAGKDTTLVF